MMVVNRTVVYWKNGRVKRDVEPLSERRSETRRDWCVCVDVVVSLILNSLDQTPEEAR